MHTVRMEHPRLPGRHIMVRPAGVKARQSWGWHVVNEAKPSRRRRVTEEETHDHAADSD